jgi:hypothetical protein
MSSYRLTLKIDEINAASERAFTDAAFLLGREFTRVITEPRNWQGFDGPRDIVDTGQLRSSQQLVFTKPLEAVYSWPVEYAAPIHEGYTLRNGKRVEGRPWTAIAAQEFDLEGTYLKLYQRYVSAI